MREIRLRYGADVLQGTEFVQQLNRIEEFELLNTLGRSDANDAVTVMVRLRLANDTVVDDIDDIAWLSIEEVVRTESTADGDALYAIVRFTHPLVTIPLEVGDAIISPGTRIGRRGAEVILRGSSDGCQALVAAFRLWNDRCTVAVVRSGDADHDADAGLTPQQVEAARLAWAMGYFDVPRGCALSDIAKSAGVSNATISGHLREVDRIAHRRLLDWIGE
jgi:predicted DNA binding protein